MNSTTHGLRCIALPPPGPGSALIEEQVQILFDYYKPSTPAEEALLRQMATADCQLARSSLYLEAHLDKQIFSATARHDADAEEHLEDLKVLLRTEPGKAVRGLKRTAAGCRWMVARFERLDARLADDGPEGGWSTFERDEAIRLLGSGCERSELQYAEHEVLDAYRHSEHVVRDAPDRLLTDPDELARYDEDQAYRAGVEKLHPDYRNSYFTGPKPVDPERPASLAWLRALIAGQLTWLREEEEYLRDKKEEPDRAGAVGRAMVLEGKEGATYARYARMHALDYNRAYNAFLKGRNGTAKTGLLPGAPNEANDPPEPTVLPGSDGFCDKSKEQESPPRVSPRAVASAYASAMPIGPGATLAKAIVTSPVKSTPASFPTSYGVTGSGDNMAADGGPRSEATMGGDGPPVPPLPAG